MRGFCLLFCIISCVAISGCAGMGSKLRDLVTGKSSGPSVQKAQEPKVSFNNQPNYNIGVKRQYKRVTNKDLEDQARFDSRSGSLWVMEGQGAYLFSQNIVRMIGDVLSVKIEGEAESQLTAKSQVISDLLNKIEERKIAQERRIASKGKEGEKDKKQEAPKKEEASAKNNEDNFTVKTVPTRIVERLVDGNYRIKGSQPFMIGKYQYKVNVTGIVRSEDFNEEGVSANKLLDPNFDIVSVRKGGNTL